MKVKVSILFDDDYYVEGVLDPSAVILAIPDHENPKHLILYTAAGEFTIKDSGAIYRMIVAETHLN